MLKKPRESQSEVFAQVFKDTVPNSKQSIVVWINCKTSRDCYDIYAARSRHTHPPVPPPPTAPHPSPTHHLSIPHSRLNWSQWRYNIAGVTTDMGPNFKKNRSDQYQSCRTKKKFRMEWNLTKLACVHSCLS